MESRKGAFLVLVLLAAIASQDVGSPVMACEGKSSCSKPRHRSRGGYYGSPPSGSGGSTSPRPTPKQPLPKPPSPSPTNPPKPPGPSPPKSSCAPPPPKPPCASRPKPPSPCPRKPPCAPRPKPPSPSPRKPPCAPRPKSPSPSPRKPPSSSSSSPPRHKSKSRTTPAPKASTPFPNTPSPIPKTPTTPMTPTTPHVPPFFTPPFIGTCPFWRSRQDLISRILGFWGSIGNIFGTPPIRSIFGGAVPTIQQALSWPRDDGYGALVREGAAALLNSIASPLDFPFSTQQVHRYLLGALSSDGAAAAQAELFKAANEGRFRRT